MRARQSDYQTSSGIRRIIENGGNEDDLTPLMQERFLPVDDVQALQLARELLANPPETGSLTIIQRPSVDASIQASD